MTTGSGSAKMRAAALGHDRQGGIRHGQSGGHLPFQREKVINVRGLS